MDYSLDWALAPSVLSIAETNSSKIWKGVEFELIKIDHGMSGSFVWFLSSEPAQVKPI